MSLLEKLPTELLERVFLFCIELNLPRASPIIAAKLSSDHIFTQCVIAAFGPWWRQMRNWENSDAWEIKDTRNGEMSPEAQSAILRCRWASLDRLRNAEQTWLRQKQRELGTTPPSLPKRYESLSQDFFDADYAHFLTKTPLLEYDEWIGQRPQESLLTFRDRAVEIPTSLLKAPWTDEKLKHLFYLYRANAEIETHKSTAGEVRRLLPHFENIS